MGEDTPISGLAALGQQANQAAQPTVNAQDVGDENLYLSPAEQEAYSQYMANRPYMPSPGALPNSTYYPTIGHQIGVGNTSGNIIGSHTIYAPAAAVVPLGMIDARNKALQDAAAGAQANVDKFRSQFQKAPTSKLTNINQQLTDEYFNFHQQSWDRALKRSGGNPQMAVQMLKNDPSFLAKNKSYYDLAKRGDAIVDKLAQINTDVRSGKRLLAPSAIEAAKQVQESMNPNSEGFKNLSTNVMKMDSSLEFSNEANRVLQGLVASKTGKAYDLSNEDDYKVFKTEVEKLSPEAIQSGLDNLNKIFDGNPLYSPDYIKKNWAGMTNFQKKTEDLSIHGKADDGVSKIILPDENSEGNVVNGKVLLTHGTKGAPETRDGQFTVYDQVTLDKPQKVVIPKSALGNLISQGKMDTKSGNVSAEIGGIANALVFKSNSDATKGFNGIMVDNGAQDVVKKSAHYEPMVSVKVHTTDKSGNDVVESEWVPLKTVENSLRNKENDKAIQEIYKRAETRTKQHQAQFTQPATPAPQAIESLRSKYNY